MNGTRHVVIAMALTGLVLFIAGDEWASNMSRFRAVKAAPKAP